MSVEAKEVSVNEEWVIERLIDVYEVALQDHNFDTCISVLETIGSYLKMW